MSRKLLSFIFVFLVLFLWSIQAYNVYKTLSNPKEVLKIINDENGDIIAVYVKGNSIDPIWEIASYNSRNSTLKVTTLSALKFPYPHIRVVSKTVTTPYNYSRVSTNYQQIIAWPKKIPALLFNGRWYTLEDFPVNNPEFNKIQEYNSIYAFYSKNDLWIGEVEIKASADASFGEFSPGKAIVPLLSNEGKATNFFYISDVNLGDFLVLPDLPKSYNPTVWRLEEQSGNVSRFTLLYPDGTKIEELQVGRTPYPCKFRLDGNLTNQMPKVIEYIRKFNAIHAGIGLFRPCNNSELMWVLVVDSNSGGVVTGGGITPQGVTWG
ncbi:hypothetical protein [Palaeococcus ferrophilus]|uniref:hypothetical protein n=1 Tax=Palaeococcus ferrophilus TaxID=83868 RepID=UPI00064F23FD|nr:hypothetical protein [Palaeococcus ferrophilus]